MKTPLKMKNLLLLLFTLLFGSLICHATIYQVGSTRTYTTPNLLYLANVVQDGDTIEVDAEIYLGTASLAVWQANNLIIKGVGGTPQLIANGQYILGKGIWVLTGDNITVENIEFSGASVPDENGAGIRLDGIGMTIRNCYFHDNENGILTGNPSTGDILIEYSEFENNGFGNGYTHNLYIGHVNKLTFRFNYSHHAFIGHNLKSRANENYILYNRIMDEQTGESSRLIDLPNGGFSIVMGNLLMQGANAQNNNLVGYGLEGLSNPLSEFYLVNNTLVNKRTASCVFVSIAASTLVANVTNNIFTGTGTVINGTTTAMSNNIIDPVIANLNFINEADFDYHLIANSPAINAGSVMSSVNGNTLTPDSAYEHPTNFSLRTLSSVIDAGAYEYNASLSVADYSLIDGLRILPNPSSDFIQIAALKSTMKYNLYNNLGQMVKKGTVNQNEKIDIKDIDSGIYFLKIKNRNTLKFVKQ